MIHILPVLDISTSLLGQSKLFAIEHGLDVSGLTLDKCQDVVLSIAASILSPKLEWVELERQLKDTSGLREILERQTTASVYAKDYVAKENVIPRFAERVLFPEVELARSTARLFPWYIAVKDALPMKLTAELKRDAELTDLYDDEMISDVWTALDNSMEHIITTCTTWDVWFMRTLGRDIYLEQGSDWRVEDWKRMRKEMGAGNGKTHLSSAMGDNNG